MGISFRTESVGTASPATPGTWSAVSAGPVVGRPAMVAAGACPSRTVATALGRCGFRVLCGLVGLKPSRAASPAAPTWANRASGHGVRVRTDPPVRDAAHLLDAVHGPGIGDKYMAPLPERPYVKELTAMSRRPTTWDCPQRLVGVAVDSEVAAETVRVARSWSSGLCGHRREPGQRLGRTRSRRSRVNSWPSPNPG